MVTVRKIIDAKYCPIEISQLPLGYEKFYSLTITETNSIAYETFSENRKYFEKTSNNKMYVSYMHYQYIF